jgi:hypothetical protein
MKDATSTEILGKIGRGLWILQDPIEVLFQELQPDCIVTDMMYCTVDSATKLGIPRIYYSSSSYFSNCAAHFIRKYRPYDDNLVSDTQKFTLPGLPHIIEMNPLQMPNWLRRFCRNLF